MRQTGLLPGGNADRGQLSFDFLVGMSVFLITLALAFSFVPTMFEPFTANSGVDMVAADRGAARLAEDLLVESSTDPIVLNATCTKEFFDGDGDTGNCAFDTEDLHDALGIDSTVGLNATIEDDDAISTVEGVTLASGSDPPDLQDTTVARRLVYLNGTEQTLYVRVW